MNNFIILMALQYGETLEGTQYPERPELSHNGGDYYYYDSLRYVNGEYLYSSWSSCELEDDYEERTVTPAEAVHLIKSMKREHREDDRYELYLKPAKVERFCLTEAK